MAPRRKIVSFAAVSAAVLYLATIGHIAFVPHVLCEHGELIDAAPQQSVRATAQPPMSPRAGFNSSLPQASVSGIEGHQHCLAATNHRNQLPDPQHAVEQSADGLKARQPVVAVVAPAGPPAIELAPKQSPPA